MKTNKSYTTVGGVTVTRTEHVYGMEAPLVDLLEQLNQRRGALFASGYEYPGRYSRWDIGFANPPVEIRARGRTFTFQALNERGLVLLDIFQDALHKHDHLEELVREKFQLRGRVCEMPSYFPEEERSKQPTIFSVLRALVDWMHHENEPHLGFYGAMGYDLVFQFEPIEMKHERGEGQSDLHLFVPDRLIVVDHRKEQVTHFDYEFSYRGSDTKGLSCETDEFVLQGGQSSEVCSDHRPGEYAKKVGVVIEGTKRGDFFEVVPSQVFSTGYDGSPSSLFENIRKTNPSPYEFLINLGEEQLVGASPEMFVRVENQIVETCPISGTVRRGTTPIEDSEKILELLNSKKDEAELTMCTDVDRNDKARICKAGTVRVLGRRMIEIYSRLIHTVDYVVGELKDECDGFDALLSHMWAVTLTGAPKPAAMQQVEDLENSARRWYGGCVGMIRFNGQINTGITIRTVHLEHGAAQVRVGATLLYDSDPESEELETRTKAEAFVDAVLGIKSSVDRSPFIVNLGMMGKRILFVDNNDSFVHTLGDYVRQTGAEITTVRAGFPKEIFEQVSPDLVFISPGPGTPEEFSVPELVGECIERQLPIFGVCLGLQGIVLALGGELGILDYPMHGKSSVVSCNQQGIFKGFPQNFIAGRYHSLYAKKENLPSCLEVSAETEDGVIMAIEHKSYPLAAVQFHPESILTLKDNRGLTLVAQAMERLAT
mgnify:CR=1 FL=1